MQRNPEEHPNKRAKVLRERQSRVTVQRWFTAKRPKGPLTVLTVVNGDGQQGPSYRSTVVNGDG